VLANQSRIYLTLIRRHWPNGPFAARDLAVAAVAFAVSRKLTHATRYIVSVTSKDVVELYEELARLDVEIWIDGGWGVDALLGRQTRHHKDLDIAIQQKDLPAFHNLLEQNGYIETRPEDAKPWNFVLADRNAREVDVHVIVLDADGNGLYGPIEKGVMYPAASLAGTGTIDEHPVRCISPEWMVKFHSGYELEEKDFKDVLALCETFGIPLPEEYARGAGSSLPS